MRFVYWSLAVSMFFISLSASAAEVSGSRGEIVSHPVTKGLSVRAIHLMTDTQTAVVDLSPGCGSCKPGGNAGRDGSCVEENECGGGCSEGGQCPCPGCEGGKCPCPGCEGGKCPECGKGLKLALDLKQDSDRDLYTTLLHASDSKNSVALMVKGGKVAGVSIQKHACHPQVP